jgi:hypothetical protein
MIIASRIFALILAGGLSGRPSIGNLSVQVETGYTQEGLPSQVLNEELLLVGDMAYSRETIQGRTVISQIDNSTGVTKTALVDGSEVLLTKDHPYAKRGSLHPPLPRPDKRRVERIAGFDCYRVRSGDDDFWVRASNPTELVAMIMHNHGRISESIVWIENRKSLDSDRRLFEFPPRARKRWVTKEELRAFRAKYVPDRTPAWIWTRP